METKYCHRDMDETIREFSSALRALVGVSLRFESGNRVADTTLPAVPVSGGSGRITGYLVAEPDSRRALQLSEAQISGVVRFLHLASAVCSGKERSDAASAAGVEAPLPKKVLQAQNYLKENFHQSLTIREVAKKLYISPSHLAHLFKETVKMSFHRYLISLRVAEARRMLMHSDMPIYEAAYRSGFGSVSQFYRAFMAETGEKPGNCRLNRANRKKSTNNSSLPRTNINL